MPPADPLLCAASGMEERQGGGRSEGGAESGHRDHGRFGIVITDFGMVLARSFLLFLAGVSAVVTLNDRLSHIRTLGTIHHGTAVGSENDGVVLLLAVLEDDRLEIPDDGTGQCFFLLL